MDKNNNIIEPKNIYIPIGIVVSIIITVSSVVWTINNQFANLKIFISENLATKVEVEGLEDRIRDLENNQSVLIYRVGQIDQ